MHACLEILFRPVIPGGGGLGGLCDEGSRGGIGFARAPVRGAAPLTGFATKGPVRSPGVGGAQRLGPSRSPTVSQISAMKLHRIVNRGQTHLHVKQSGLQGLKGCWSPLERSPCPCSHRHLAPPLGGLSRGLADGSCFLGNVFHRP